MTEGTAVVAEVRVSGESRRLPSQIENNALRIGQEALTNAIKHAEPKHVLIELNFEAANLQLRVKDDGRGIAADALPRVFDRFYRVSKARSREMGGSGLGLSIAKAIVEGHGGTILMDSVVDRGTTVTAELPALASG